LQHSADYLIISSTSVHLLETFIVKHAQQFKGLLQKNSVAWARKQNLNAVCCRLIQILKMCEATIDTIIPYTSNDPKQHKFAAVRFLYNRLNTYQLQPAKYQQEENIIHNTFPILPQKSTLQLPPHPEKKPTARSWATFTYTG
jgi:hypothetical protein